ncbi:probable chromosome segregation protein [Lentisphaera araneosa HTCC2155]|uniref:Probable chromosome segregation protein n=1 Tax=Lentisphaera araneosa HTCC2155 TaxID=313628 RepID=A6DRU3_9BACT|nr:PSD1 and planctomycete cytochrome C domain-containing protein [Lentisphaera araneosa]EDM25628.1 probable chromosome segregation protein [Lentisphaera araneosa HTCC2155]
MFSKSLISSLICFLSTYLVANEKVDFNRDVRPILSDKCYACHGPDAHDIKGKLQLHDFDLATKERHYTSRSGKQRTLDPAIIPGDPENSLFWERIISDDSDEVMPPPKSHKTLSKNEKNILKQWIASGAKYDSHWAFKELATHKSPSSIDQLVKENISEFQFNPQADKRTLIRRLSFDLTGLPPSLGEVKNFINDKSPQAYENLVNQYLSRSTYGENMAVYWLDLVRYGDTHGLHSDDYREMYAYRDWVIKAFNANMPFDQFITEQLAGDLLPKPTNDQLIASGFNRLHISNSAGSALKEELFVNNVKDRTDAFGTVFLGLTLGCASCHDHKFDPLTQKEYYQFYAFFNNLDGAPDNKRHKSPAPRLLLPSKQEAMQLSKAKNAKDRINLEKKIPSTPIMKERKELRPAFILNRGEYDNPGERVQRKTPSFLPAMDKSFPVDRLGLAQWLTTPNHPLTARVAVNRFWQQFFGRGLVKTSEDFGFQGTYPSHPKLLDSLAQSFVKNNWNTKALIKQIVMSRTYRQSSQSSVSKYKNDPDNRRLERGPRFRLNSEVLRDQALYISGQLNSKMYGPSVKPPQPDGLWKSVAFAGSNTGKFTADKGAKIYRRSLYTFVKRSMPNPVMSIFNAPSRETCIARRERTNTPMQALVIMNEEQFLEASIKLAQLSLKHSSKTEEQIDFLYETMFAELPSKTQIKLISAALVDFKKDFQAHTQLAKHKLTAEEAARALLVNSLMGLDKFKTKE